MSNRTVGVKRRISARMATRFVAGGVVLGGAALFLCLGAGAATADDDEMAPSPQVTSRQASEFSAVRINDFGVARGISETRVGEAGRVSAQGEVRGSPRAVVGTTAIGFEGWYPTGPGMGDW